MAVNISKIEGMCQGSNVNFDLEESINEMCFYMAMGRWDRYMIVDRNDFIEDFSRYFLPIFYTCEIKSQNRDHNKLNFNITCICCCMWDLFGLT